MNATVFNTGGKIASGATIPEKIKTSESCSARKASARVDQNAREASQKPHNNRSAQAKISDNRKSSPFSKLRLNTGCNIKASSKTKGTVKSKYTILPATSLARTW